MEGNELFLILPPHEEAKCQPLYLKRNGEMSNEELTAFIYEIEHVNSFFTHENYTLYYDSENLKAFLIPIEILPECYPQKGQLLRRLLANQAEDWRRNCQQKSEETYSHLKITIANDTLCEITKRVSESTHPNTYLLLNHQALKSTENPIKITCNCSEKSISVCDLNLKKLAAWFEQNRIPQRFFNLNPKHGEEGKGAHRSNKGSKVSILMTNKEEATKLLQRALGEDPKTLFFFDSKQKMYIEFKQEHDQTYHGFHLDKEEQDRVPKSILKKIEELL